VDGGGDEDPGAIGPWRWRRCVCGLRNGGVVGHRPRVWRLPTTKAHPEARRQPL